MKQKNIGIKTEFPKTKCEDRNCPFHGSLRVRNKTIQGTVLSTKMQKTAIVGWEWICFLKKVERYEKRITKVKAHSPLCIDAKEGDIVRIAQCRPLSKSKNYVIIEKVGHEKGFKEKMEAKEEAKIKKIEVKSEVKDATSESKSD